MIIFSASFLTCQYPISVELHARRWFHDDMISMGMTRRPRFHHRRHHHHPLDAPLFCIFFLLFIRPLRFSFKRDACVMIAVIYVTSAMTTMAMMTMMMVATTTMITMTMMICFLQTWPGDENGDDDGGDDDCGDDDGDEGSSSSSSSPSPRPLAIYAF